MHPSYATMRASACRAAALLLSLATPLAAKDAPGFHVSQFNQYPANLGYFRDSDVVLFQDTVANVVYRSPDAGATWERVDGVPAGRAYMVYMHAFDDDRAYVLTKGHEHFRTHDRGKTWQAWESGAQTSIFRSDILQFHAADPDRVIFNGMECRGIFCEEVAAYTLDGFRTDPRFLRGNTAGCRWAASSATFSTGDEFLDRHRILCIARDAFSPLKQDQRLFISDSYFAANETESLAEFEPALDTTRPVRGIVNAAVVKKFLLVATASANTDEMALFISDDSVRWHRAEFAAGSRVEQDAYTALESTDYSVQIDVMTTRPSNPMGALFTSNSNGTYFTLNTEHTNRNEFGRVDFEKMTNVDGIFLLNRVDNWQDVEKSASAEKRVVSEITFDDGRTFEAVETDAGKRLHLHSVTNLHNLGAVFSSPAPGLVMGVGNTGDALESYWDGDLYVSDNAGLTWTRGLEGPHKYEFGDQGSVLVAVRDSEDADVGEVRYSLDHGQTWETAALPDGIKMRPWILTTSPDAATLKFLLVGENKNKEADDPFFVVAIDFDGLHEKTCGPGDLEDWFPRVDEDGQPICVMGRRQKFRRRTKTAKCFIKGGHKHEDAKTENCECADRDFECDYNFVRDAADPKRCVAAAPLAAPDGACGEGSKPDDEFSGPSGWRLIPGDTCQRKGGRQKDDKTTRKCSEAHGSDGKPASGEVESSQHVFGDQGSWTRLEKHYLERGDSSSDDDETILVRPIGSRGAGPISVTHDHGKTWTRPEHLPADDVVWIVPHHYFKDMVFFVTETTRVHYTADRGRNFHSFEAPLPAAVARGRSPLAFHPDNKNWLLWLGQKCEHDECYLVASFSRDRGDHWQTAARYVARCEFTGSDALRYPGRRVEQILCLQRAEERDDPDTPLDLVLSDDWFDRRDVVRRDVKDFATMAEFIVAATSNSDSEANLEAVASLDGRNFSEAHFPYGFEVPHHHAYTVLDSSTHAVNLFVVTERAPGRGFGSIMKSNSNGTSYVLSIAHVNCDDDSYVDFEKMLGLEGVALVNVVANPEAAHEPKRLQTRITHNDGAQWAYLPPPPSDVDGKSFGCASAHGDANCALHIHGYTERVDHRKTYSSQGAVGLMLGWGNVGPELGPSRDADTFMTADGGISWRMVKRGRWAWVILDQGALVALVQPAPIKKATDTLSYSTDEGATWSDYQFADEPVEVADITTMRSGASRDALIFARGKDGSLSTINLDFSGLAGRQCRYLDDDPASDYYVWSPKHPLQQDNCLFGHVAQYLRKKPEQACYSDFTLEHLFAVQNCSCTRQDFECAYNYELDNSGACQLVPGLQPLSADAWCKDHPDAVEYFEPTGYRRIPLTTCAGGLEMDRASASHPCLGHEDEYRRKHAGPSGAALFFAVVVPLAAASAIGWYVWRNYRSAFVGQIRLGDSSYSRLRGGELLDSDRPWVRYPVIAVSAAAAVLAALPLLVGALWRSTRSAADRWSPFNGCRRGGSCSGDGARSSAPRRFTTRDSFARGRGDYTMIDDEGELLGDVSDDDV